jgi:hypothetical protein
MARHLLSVRVTTITIFGSGSQGGSLTVTTTGDITPSLGPSIAVISGEAYTIDPSAIPTTTVVNGQTINIGSGDVGLATKTIPPSLFTGGADASRGLVKSGGLSALFLVTIGGLIMEQDDDFDFAFICMIPVEWVGFLHILV